MEVMVRSQRFSLLLILCLFIGTSARPVAAWVPLTFPPEAGESAGLVPNDPEFSKQFWALDKIDGPEAWEITTGSRSVVVAVFDGGIDYNHQDLLDNMFRNNPDCNADGQDNDGNGFVDDCFGIDPLDNDSDPMDEDGHGTGVAGIIGAIGNNNLGVVGVNWDLQLLACRRTGTTSASIACAEYVALMKDRGVNIVAVNMSFSDADNPDLFDAINALRTRDILVVAAAGNSALDHDIDPFFPASFYLPNIIAVAATTQTDELASFSDFGRHSVHIGAPGVSLRTTGLANTYTDFGYTSGAAPFVTGVAALVKAQNPQRNWKAIKNLIIAGGDTVPGLNTVGQKRLNAHGALTCADSVVLSRLKPRWGLITAVVGEPVELAVLHINCENPNGEVAVSVAPGGEVITLIDDGVGTDQEPGDGVYSGQWVPQSAGTFTISFPGDDVVTVVVSPGLYRVEETEFRYRTFLGTNLNLDVDTVVAEVASPFPIPFAGASFSTLFVASKGFVSFNGPHAGWYFSHMPNPHAWTMVTPLGAVLNPLPGADQNVFWDVLGTAPNRELVIEWRDVPLHHCRDKVLSFQVVFFEGSDRILFNYRDADLEKKCPQTGFLGAGVQVSPLTATELPPDLRKDNTAALWTLDLTPQFALTVNKAGPGSGTVTSSPSGINCGSDCSETYTSGTTVTLSAMPARGAIFAGWSGGGCSGKGTCTVIMTADTTVTATFNLQRFTLTVTKAGKGSGTVASSPPGINCGLDCSERYSSGTMVTLTATPSKGSIFRGWNGGGCRGTGTCTVIMGNDTSVTATFKLGSGRRAGQVDEPVEELLSRIEPRIKGK